MYALDLNAQAADLHRAEAERVARNERLIAEARGSVASRLGRLWTRLRTPRRAHTLAA